VKRRDAPARWPGLAAASLCAVLGLLQATVGWHATVPLAPRLADLLAPLAAAPLPAGAPVALAIPAAVPRERAMPALYEAAWQRPDLHWTLAEGDARVGFVVALPGGRAPAGFSEAWRGGSLVVFRRLGR
jgi:hypothetical protein